MPTNPNPIPAPNSIPSTPSSQVILDMAELLRMMTEKKASDLHISSGRAADAPYRWANGSYCIPQTDCRNLSASGVFTFDRYSKNNVLNPKRSTNWTISFSASKIAGRVRMNVFRQRGAVGKVALRAIPQKIQALDELGLPAVAYDNSGKFQRD